MDKAMTPIDSDHYVTHREFSSFKENTEASLHRIEKSLEKQSQDSKFPVGILITMLSMCAASVLYVVSAQTAPLQSQLEKHERLDGHSATVVRLAETAGQMSALSAMASVNASDIKNLEDKTTSILSTIFTQDQGYDLIERVVKIETSIANTKEAKQ